MNPLLKITLAGFAVSIAGSLPLGVLNVTAFRIAAAEGIINAVLFGTGAALVEVVYLQLTLYSTQWLQQQQRLLYWMQWCTAFLFAAIAIHHFVLAFTPVPALQPVATVTTGQRGNRFCTGILLSAINPAQFPFWIGWNTFLLSKGILKAGKYYYRCYLTGAGAGTIAGLCIFIGAGWLLSQQSTPDPAWINSITGFVYIICDGILLYKLLISPRPAKASSDQAHAPLS
jgi:threonine/homoserine/homoserine lactone efflux protein